MVFKKNMFTLNTFYWVNLERKYFNILAYIVLFSINISSMYFFFVNCTMVFLQNGDVAKRRIIMSRGCRPTSIK